MISEKELKAVLSYDPETGIFTWLKTLSFRRQAGRQAGGIRRSDGYVRVSVFYRRYRASRLAWFYMTGKWPKEDVDHINGVRDDNRFSNLREANQTQQMQNQGIRSDNTTGRRGICFYKARGKYRARIQSRGKCIQIGDFDTLDQAIAARERVEKTMFGDFCPSPRKAYAPEVGYAVD